MTRQDVAAAVAGIARVSRIIAGRWTVYVLMIAGLALAYCAAIVIGLYVRDELTYDRFIPNSGRIYLVSAKYGPAGRPLVDSDLAPAGVARWMRSDLPEADHVARLDPQAWPIATPRRQVKERFFWADPAIFEILDLPALYGNPETALSEPGSVVLTRRLALAYFGRDDVIGQVLVANGTIALTVTAVLKDLPPNTHLDREMFVSGRAAYARLSIYDTDRDLLWPNTYTYATFRPGTDVAKIPGKMAGISRRHWQGPNNLPDGFALVPLRDLHFRPHGDGEMKPRGHLDSIAALVGVGLAIMSLACINFAGLILAERNERAAEMTIYRALGARRMDLVAQTLREAVVVNLISAWLGLVAAERLLPGINATLDLHLSLWAHPLQVLAATVCAAAIMAAAGGLVPALIVSRPARVLRPADAAASMRWRSWVVAQLTLVIVLLVASHVMSRQWAYATTQALGFDGDNVVLVRLLDDPPISAAFMRDVGAVPGVQAAAASWGTPTNDFVRPAWIRPAGRPMIALTRNSVHPDFLKVYRVGLLAGRNLSGTFLSPEVPKEILINLAAVKALGFRTPAEAVGQVIEYDTDQTRMRSTVVGVVPDLRVSTVYEPVSPMIFDSFSKYFMQVSIRIDPAAVPDTLRRIDTLWLRDAAGTVPIERRFFRDYLMQQYRDLHQQMLVFYMVSAAAIILSVLGLTGLSIFLTRHQIREIAIHKALGATFADLFIQRLSPFIAPLLLANLVAWPVAWLLLSGWLNAFADHIALPVFPFAGAGAAITLIALVTVAAHSVLVVRTLSISSLRHE